MRMIRGLARSGTVAGACLLLAGLIVPAAAARAAGVRVATVPTPGASGQLNDVACPPGGQCWAVGVWANKNYYQHNEAYRWTGSQWTAVSVPQPPVQSAIESVSCPAASGCLAVGLNRAGRVTRPEALRWDGSAWSQISAPAFRGSLTAVSCVSMSDCQAVNAFSTVHWNGTGWSTPYDFPHGFFLSGISCVSATSCWIAGYYANPQTLALSNVILHGSGTSWTSEPVPQPDGSNDLSGIGCRTAADCWAVGSEFPSGSGNYVNETLHWNGTAWSAVAAPAGSQPYSELIGVSCLTRADCWAMGDDNGRTQALHWNGTAWSAAATPDPGGGGVLLSVRCLSSADCLAVGFGHVSPEKNLALHWNGTAWATS